MIDFIEKDGRKRRNTITVRCDNCGKELASRKDQVRKYCSRTCSSLGQRKRVEAPCGYCGQKFEILATKLAKSKSGLVFCSRAHKDTAQRLENGIASLHPPHYGDGKATYRTRALREYGHKCAGCGYCELEDMLDVHHVDGDRNHNSLKNLIVLCVFCHALVTRGFAKVEKDRTIVRA